MNDHPVPRAPGVPSPASSRLLPGTPHSERGWARWGLFLLAALRKSHDVAAYGEISPAPRPWHGVVLAGALLAAGCAPLTDSMQYGGVTVVEVPTEAGIASFRSGKEYGSVRVRMTTPDGREYEFDAVGVEAFQGQAISASSAVRMQELSNEILLEALSRSLGAPVPQPEISDEQD